MDQVLELPQIEESKQLSKIVDQAGLELNEGEKIKQSYLPYFEQLAQIKEDSKKINFENPTPLDEKIALDLKKRTVKIRTGSEVLKNERKRIYLLKGDLEQSAWNLIKQTCLLEEEHFEQIAKRREIAEKIRVETITKERSTELQPYAEFVPTGIDLGRMTDEDYGKLLSGAKMQYDFKVELLRKQEAERIEKTKAEAEERERIRIENEKLKAEAELHAKELEAERQRVAAEKAEAEAKAKKEREAAEKALAEEKAKAEAERKIAEEKARKEREAVEVKLKAEAEAKAKLEAEIRAKAIAEENERKAKILAEKKAAAAPDKNKLEILVNSALGLPYPDLTTDEAETICKAFRLAMSEAVENLRQAIQTL